MEYEKIIGKYNRTIYQSASYGVSIALYDTKSGAIVVTGAMLPTAKNLSYEFTGSHLVHPKYGKQFKAISFTEYIDNTEAAIIEYLSSGVIKGIGKKTATKIVARFGTDTIKVLEESIDVLRQIPGISEKKFEKIKETFEAAKASRESMLLLAKYGISQKLAAKAYKMFQSDTPKIIAETPYLLCFVPGITFPVADSIGEHKEESYETSYERFKCCARYCLYQNEQNGLKPYIGDRTAGSIGMDKNDFGKAMLSLLYRKKISGEFICNNTIRMIKEGELIYRTLEDGSQLLALPGMYALEKSIAENVYRLCKNTPAKADLRCLLAEAEKQTGVTLGAMQRKAVLNVFSNGLSIICGPPGSGKTTTIKVIAYIYKKLYKGEIHFLAPTGKAAARIKESSGYEASTIHSAISIGTDLINEPVEKEVIFEDCLLCVDELSMLDVRVASQLFQSIGDGVITVLCGDPDQLQSVGAGSVLRDLIGSNNVPVTKLDTVYRQAKGGQIYENTDRIRKGNAQMLEGGEFNFHEFSDTEAMEDYLVKLYLEKIDEFGIENVMLISPFREHNAGVNALNRRIHEILSPIGVNDTIFEYGSTYFRKGDLVMQLKNTAEGVVNGDIGMVSGIGKKDGEDCLYVTFADGITLSYTKDNIEDIALAYCYTVHKSQGSEAKCVITSCHSMHSVMLKRNNIYTAITRAKAEVHICGERRAFERAVHTEDKGMRHTFLCSLLKKQFGDFTSISFVVG